MRPNPGNRPPRGGQAPIDRAFALHQKGDFEGALRAYRKILRSRPDDAVANRLLGIALIQSGQRDQGLDILREQGRRHPRNPETAQTVGQALIEAGELAEALEFLRHACAALPQHAQLHNLHGIAAKRLGHHDEATKAFERAQALQPENTDYVQNYCQALIDERRLEEAYNRAMQVIRSNPKLPVFHQLAGGALLLGERNMAAFVHYENAARLAPNDPGIVAEYGAACAELRDFPEATSALKHALRLNPNLYKARLNYTRSLKMEGKIDAAIEQFEILAKMPDFKGDANVTRAELAYLNGDFASVMTRLTPYLEHPESKAAACTLLCRVAHKLDRVDEAIARAEAVLAEFDARRGTPDAETVSSNLLFALGQLYDKVGRYEQAFRRIAEGNELMRIPYDRQARHDLVSRLIATYNVDNLDRLPVSGNTSRKPIFIVGMPRSGTSLLEQILDSHPEIYGAGELARIARYVTITKRKTGQDYPEFAAGLEPGLLRQAADRHLEFLDTLANGEPYVTDKLPHNFLNVGFILQLFPNARIINCRRDPLDSGLSIYFQPFAAGAGHPYQSDLGDIGYEYRQYLRLAQHWEKTYDIHTVAYEDVTHEPVETTQKLFDYLGIEWRPEVLEFHKSKRVVTTASMQQVREKLYTQSVERWRHYEAHIGPLREELEKPLDAP